MTTIFPPEQRPAPAGRLPTIPAVPPVLNVAAYRFVDIDDPGLLREHLLTSAQTAGLMGTVLIAPEGINLFLAGAPDSVRGWLATLRQDARFAGLEAKESYSDEAPFRRLRVRLKREIIRMNHPAVRPAAGERRPWTQRRWRAGSPQAAATKAGRSRCSTRATPSRWTRVPSKAPSTGG
jgi:hypothetical protein